MPEISKIKMPSGTVYDIKDATARSMAGGAIVLRGETTTPLTDDATTNPIKIDGEDYTAVNQDAVFYNHKEFVFDGTKWHEFGDLTGLGSLAFKNSASGSYTPAVTVTQPTFTGSSSTIISGFDRSSFARSTFVLQPPESSVTSVSRPRAASPKACATSSIF